MNDTNLALLEKNRDILSIRDLATGTIATYTSYLTDYINWVEENLPGRSLSDVTFRPHQFSQFRVNGGTFPTEAEVPAVRKKTAVC